MVPLLFLVSVGLEDVSLPRSPRAKERRTSSECPRNRREGRENVDGAVRNDDDDAFVVVAAAVDDDDEKANVPEVVADEQRLMLVVSFPLPGGASGEVRVGILSSPPTLIGGRWVWG